MPLDTVQPDEKYNKDKFVKAVGAVSSLEQLAKQASEDVRNQELLIIAGQDLRDDPDFYLNMTGPSGQWTGDLALKSDLDVAKNIYSGALREYTGKNIQSILRGYDNKKLEHLAEALPTIPELALQSPLGKFLEASELFALKTEDEKLDKVGNALNELTLIKSFLKREDKNEFDAYILGRLQKVEGSKDPHEQFLVQSYLRGRGIPGYSKQTMEAYKRQAELDVKDALYRKVTKGKGEEKEVEYVFRNKLIRDLITKAYEKADDVVKGVYSSKVYSLAA